MHNSGLYKDPAFSVSVGIAALILEGRPNYNVCHDVLLNYDESRKNSSSSDTFFINEFGRARSEGTTTQRISQKLQQIRNFPSTSKDYVEQTVEISVGSPSSGRTTSSSDEFAERIYVNRKFLSNNEYHRTSSTSKSATTRSLFSKNIDSNWTETNIVYNGLENMKILHNISPLKLTPITKHHSNTKKKQNSGPHCEQFLKKIGLVKSEGCREDEIDHKCDYFNNICRAWQSNLSKITSILATSESVCIEVFLGPESHTILLEQWIIKTVDKSSRPMMSLQSLCSAIRSQLYFSQIVAWTEQLNTSPLPYDVINNPRIIKGDQGTTAKLDIFFRIRSFGDDSCFSEKPLVHQFPEANLTESTSILVCLKSLPRMNNIPTVAGVMGKCENVELVSEKKLHVCTEKGKHRCRDEGESPSKEENKFQNTFPIPSSEHREKQLQKYRKRIQKREKSKKKSDSSSKSDDSSDNQFSQTQPHSIQGCMTTNMNSTTTTTTPTSIVMEKNCGDCDKTTQTIMPQANSVGTQTECCDITMGCYTHHCLHCDNERKCCEEKESPLEKADILLQALERTASVNSKRQKESIYMNMHEMIKRQKCCQNSSKKPDSHPNEGTSFITEQNVVTENNNKIITPLPDVAVVDHPSNVRFFREPDCDTCLNHENENLLDSELFLNVVCSSSGSSSNNNEGGVRSNPKNISNMRSSSENVFHFDDDAASSPCSSSLTSILSTPVQKSSSAPTFYYNHNNNNASTSSLSPRFCRLAAIYNRRSRHLSDRSSTSEEQFSDDETNPFISKSSGGQLMKFSRGKDLGIFRRTALLGSLEESLLHYRIPIKHQVIGFKVLLGASGSFCPTQLTVPAVSAFYELDGDSVLTPYVSEFKLPRKGYCVPRQGTIQVTLLNPLGTVVRMFVVPYDYSDMPPTNVSFIRQRILARNLESQTDTCPNTHEFEKLTRNEQMRLLRYAIHLRFKTSRSGRLYLHTDVKILVLRRPDCDTAAAHANNSILESPNELNILTIVPEPKYSQRFDK